MESLVHHVVRITTASTSVLSAGIDGLACLPRITPTGSTWNENAASSPRWKPLYRLNPLCTVSQWQPSLALSVMLDAKSFEAANTVTNAGNRLNGGRVSIVPLR